MRFVPVPEEGDIVRVGIIGTGAMSHKHAQAHRNRLPAVEPCAQTKKHVLVEKSVATNLATAGSILHAARNAEIQLGVVSQHRFDDSARLLKKAIAAGRLGNIIQADAYVKWYRSAEYYSRPIKGSWAGEGGGALIDRAIASRASDPMAISTLTLKRQFLDFGDACKTGRLPLVSALDGYRALQVVTSICDSCQQGCRIVLDHAAL
jgi:predicted dehydrogenase